MTGGASRGTHEGDGRDSGVASGPGFLGGSQVQFVLDGRTYTFDVSGFNVDESGLELTKEQAYERLIDLAREVAQRV